MDIQVTWTQIKNFASSKSRPIQYVDFNGNYYIYINDGPFAINTIISQENPSNSDLIDFETNYKPTANQPNITTSSLAAGSASIGTIAIDQTTPGTTNGININNTSIATTQSGTWTVQPGNTANTTAWKVDGSAVTQPVSQIGNWNMRTQDGSGNNISSISFDSKQSLSVFPNMGFSTASNTRVGISASASTQLLAANTGRRYAYIMNQINFPCYIMLGASAVLGQGIIIHPGGMYEITSTNLWTGTINAINTSLSSVNIDVFEGTA